ncbi:signal peptide peptidase SppA [Pseudovibrio exalbescens]|uniref:signal peptide peptidase SppA n=1 Tax=Pseudovibrio exalbescens TaxID=197461 RepID=UPI002366F37E|nr:signal peptide peptidase SppA [Pseudovibrio exalbescens]MDD7909787.1 signal peptide peptidase SppA [Pseudovibrio exalbescens]
MSLDSDIVIDRRRLRRKVSFWRILCFLIVVLGIGTFILMNSSVADFSKSRQHIARITVNGAILDDRERLEMISRIAESDSVRGVIVSINSPGGTTTGGEALYGALRKLAEEKPVVATIGTIGASAGYMTAIAADHVVARYNSLTGSIGVLFQFGNAKGLLDMIGLEMDTVKSSPLKAEPNFYEPASPEAKAVLESLVTDSYEWFVGLVAERRGFTSEEAHALANGQVYSGHQAVENKLVDAIGGEEVAITWLEEERNVPSDLKVIDWKIPKETELGLFANASSGNSLPANLDYLLNALIYSAKNLGDQASSLDGLVSVWHAPGAATRSMQGGAEHD